MLKNKNGENLIDQIYPIGSIYISVNSNDPSIYFGGEWERCANGRTLIGVNESDNDFNLAKKEGGNKTYTLNLLTSANNQGTTVQGPGYGGKVIINESQGNGAYIQKHINVLQPYFTCYIWQRIA